MRSYRAGNSYNRQETPGADTVFLGEAQIAWLKRQLRASKAVWKVIASDMPIGLQVGDGTDAQGRPRWKMRRTAMALCWAGSSKSLISSATSNTKRSLTLYG